MIREIKFRGFSVLFNKWIYGVGLKYDLKRIPQIYTENGWYTVALNSEGQFIGKKDKHGEEIYERDIVEWGGVRGVIVYDNCAFQLDCPNDEWGYLPMGETILKGSEEVLPLKIGNTYEHPNEMESVK